MTKRIRSKISRGSAELAILALLAEQPLYGFEICKRIEEKTAGALSFTMASLYPMLYDLEKRGSIAGRWEANHAGRDRRVYTSHPVARRNWPRCAGNGISFSRLSIASRGCQCLTTSPAAGSVGPRTPAPTRPSGKRSGRNRGGVGRPSGRSLRRETRAGNKRTGSCRRRCPRGRPLAIACSPHSTCKTQGGNYERSN